jgi:hypothetical protein
MSDSPPHGQVIHAKAATCQTDWGLPSGLTPVQMDLLANSGSRQGCRWRAQTFCAKPGSMTIAPAINIRTSRARTPRKTVPLEAENGQRHYHRATSTATNEADVRYHLVCSGNAERYADRRG